ncbi:sulfotransferase [Luteolibacter sp. Populi]|uniref:sulfotransferase family protein n=1 Tax=Luteolibacter sp. Populi TaxID=3230487 RepID=UPI0034654A94
MPDTQIVFLLSMPRAGSTLLQRLLMGSGICKTVGEPSFLLRLLGLGGEPILRAATYSEALVETAIDDMRKAWGGFDACWKKGVHDLAVSVYNGLAGDFPYFLDKTPRYSLIADELVEVFPEAKFIILWRHPIAVMNSMSTTFREGRWEPHSFDLDLYHGIDQLRKVCAKHGDRVHQVKYEDLAANPEEELARLGAYLGMPNLAEVAGKELVKGNEGKLGDPTGVKKVLEGFRGQHLRVGGGHPQLVPRALGEGLLHRRAGRVLPRDGLRHPATDEGWDGAAGFVRRHPRLAVCLAGDEPADFAAARVEAEDPEAGEEARVSCDFPLRDFCSDGEVWQQALAITHVV